MAKRVAVIDIGSNSVRMVVYEKTSRFAFHILHEAKSRVRLSENAYQNNGNLQEIPMQRTFSALSNFLTIISSFKARKTLCVATSALRDAPNKKEFLNKIKNELGLKIRVIDGPKESYFGAVACANLLPEQEDALSIDIGGGSTEFAIINKKNIDSNISLNLGTVRLKELFFDNNDIEGARTYIDNELSKLNNLKASTIIGIGGTFRAISNALIQRSNYPFEKLHAYQPDYSEFTNFISDILGSSEESLEELCIKNSRYDVIKPGALIVERIFKKFEINKLITSGVGVREGVYLTDLLRNSKDKLPTNYNTSVRYILDSHVCNAQHSNQLSRVSKELFDITHDELGISKEYRYELAIAAKLFISGINIHKHNYHLIKDELKYGLTHKQIILVATLARYANRKFPSTSHVEKYQDLLPSKDELDALCYLLSLSISLLSHRPKNIDFSMTFQDSVLNIESKNSLYLAKESINKLNSLKKFNINFS